MVTLCRPYAVNEEMLRFEIISQVKLNILTILVGPCT